MWVIYSLETGREYDRVETVEERDFVLWDATRNYLGEQFAYRYED